MDEGKGFQSISVEDLMNLKISDLSPKETEELIKILENMANLPDPDGVVIDYDSLQP